MARCQQAAGGRARLLHFGKATKSKQLENPTRAPVLGSKLGTLHETRTWFVTIPCTINQRWVADMGSPMGACAIGSGFPDGFGSCGPGGIARPALVRHRIRILRLLRKVRGAVMIAGAQQRRSWALNPLVATTVTWP